MVIPSLSEAEAAALFPNGVDTKEVPSGKKYLRYTQLWRDAKDQTCFLSRPGQRAKNALTQV